MSCLVNDVAQPLRVRFFPARSVAAFHTYFSTASLPLRLPGASCLS